MSSVLAVACDKSYVSQAKQVFSGAFYRGAWQGDFLLISYGIRDKDLEWFRERNICILPAGYIWSGSQNYPNPVLYSRYFSFKEQIRMCWDNVVFMDADIIVNTDLAPLSAVEGFCAVKEEYCDFMPDYLNTSPVEVREEILFGYQGNDVFNSGVFAFSTKIIKENTFDKIVDWTKRYSSGSQWPDQLVLNMFFKDWTRLPKKYNVQLPASEHVSSEKLAMINDCVLHFIWKPKPWDIEPHPWKQVWIESLRQADQVYLDPKACKKWNGIMESMFP